jgi:hypothetical protein
MVPVSIAILGKQVNAVNGFFQIAAFAQYSTDIIFTKTAPPSLEMRQRNRFPSGPPQTILFFNIINMEERFTDKA